jgi:hypothetical protein
MLLDESWEMHGTDYYTLDRRLHPRQGRIANEKAHLNRIQWVHKRQVLATDAHYY